MATPPPSQIDTQHQNPKHLSLFLPSLAGGGVAQVFVTLANNFRQRGFKVDLVVCRATGPQLQRLSPGVRLVELPKSRTIIGRLYALFADPLGLKAMLKPILLSKQPPEALSYLPGLVHYLQNEAPLSLLIAKTHTNLIAIWAAKLAKTTTRIVISERTNLSFQLDGPKSHKWRWRYIAPVVHRTYSQAQDIISVSNGVADDLSSRAHIPRHSITTIYNPIVTPALLEKAKEPLSHPWFAPGSPPVILGVGRLAPQKDFPTLITAFARFRAKRPSRLMILGHAKNESYKNKLLGIARQLGIDKDILLLGFMTNPYVYMAKASLFVLSSRWEGLPGVLIQALACGCPVVSTNCLNGPAEILGNGEYGRLVPVGDPEALSEAMLRTLEKPIPSETLRIRSLMFTQKAAIDKYLDHLFGEKVNRKE